MEGYVEDEKEGGRGGARYFFKISLAECPTQTTNYFLPASFTQESVERKEEGGKMTHIVPEHQQ
jgi:hypothetical protein